MAEGEDASHIVILCHTAVPSQTHAHAYAHARSIVDADTDAYAIYDVEQRLVILVRPAVMLRVLLLASDGSSDLLAQGHFIEPGGRVERRGQMLLAPDVPFTQTIAFLQHPDLFLYRLAILLETHLAHQTEFRVFPRSAAFPLDSQRLLLLAALKLGEFLC